ncbi:MAG: nitrogenase component 1 [Theionarchaea archaeon]|nr:nitrogenase component 1 [Theionarchaea archaeon]
MTLLQHSTDPYCACSLYGAALTIAGIHNTAMIVHGPQGCEVSASAAYSYQNVDYTGKLIACTKLSEVDVVTGGEIKLSNTLKKLAATYDPELLVILAGCAPEIIGDDVLSVSGHIEEETGIPVVPITVGGFRGSEHVGIDLALQMLIEKLAIPQEKTSESSVNLVAPFASSNPGWMGDLGWVKEILAALGIRINAVLCSDTTVSDIERVGRAEATLLLTHNAGYTPCTMIEERYDVPFILKELPLPIGLHCTRQWIEALGTYFDREEKASDIIEKGEQEVVDTLRLRFIPIHWFHEHPTVIVGDLTNSIGLLDFITRELEMDPLAVCVRKATRDARPILESVVKDLGISPLIEYDADIATVRSVLQEVRPMSVFGSLVEKHLCKQMGIKVVYRLFNPIDRVDYFNYPLMGHEGLLKILEFTINNWRNSATEGFK